MSKKIGNLHDGLDAVQAQVSGLTTAFKSYVAETDLYRIANDKRLDGIDTRLAGVDTRLSNIDTRLDNLQNDLNDFKQAVNVRFDKLEQTMNQDFALLFARLGIQS